MFTIIQIKQIFEQAYSKRWKIGKDNFYAIESFIKLLELLEAKGTQNVEEALKGIDLDSDDYPI